MELFDPGPGKRDDMPDEVFAFGRTASRLTEMQGKDYLKRRVFLLHLVLCIFWFVVHASSLGKCACTVLFHEYNGI